MKIAVNCGHGKSVDGSWDSGCTYGKYTEAGLMLPITKATVKYLRASGITVISDADKNNNRNMISDVRWANNQKCKAYISIHCDYKKAPSGCMPLYVSEKGKKLATCINNSIKSGMKMKSRGVVRRTDLWELNGTDMVACIVETGSIRYDLNTLLKKPDSYGKAIAKGICKYLGVEFKDGKKPKPAPKKETETSKKKVVPSTKAKTPTIGDKVLDACKAQAMCMKNAKYGWQSKPTIEKSKKLGTCVSFVACVLQRLGVLKSGQALWHNGRGYGTGKVTGANDKMDVTYMGNKTLTSLKDKLKAGDIILLDDNKSGVKGSGGHIFVVTGKWKGSDPYIWDMEPGRKCVKTQKPRTYSGKRKVLARVRLK